MSGVVLWIAVAGIGGVGAIARFLLDGWISASSTRSLPLGTLAVNVSGALALGLLTGLPLTGDALLLAGSAAIGSYTTFSTWMFETHRLGEDSRGREAMGNVVISIALGLAAAALGRALGGWL